MYRIASAISISLSSAAAAASSVPFAAASSRSAVAMLRRAVPISYAKPRMRVRLSRGRTWRERGGVIGTISRLTLSSGMRSMSRTSPRALRPLRLNCMLGIQAGRYFTNEPHDQRRLRFK